MRIIITCGPGHEPIDEVRRLTNTSTGALGLALAAALSRAGHEVFCLKGEGATARGDVGGVEWAQFSTGADLLEKLRMRAGRAEAVLHAAALCDYRVKAVHAGDGGEIRAAKIPSRAGEITLTLEPAIKVLPLLRDLFPAARIVGWKYELEGTRDDAMAKVARQFAEARNDACVVNGAAWGPGFGFAEPGVAPVELADATVLAAHFVQWLGR